MRSCFSLSSLRAFLLKTSVNFPLQNFKEKKTKQNKTKSFAEKINTIVLGFPEQKYWMVSSWQPLRLYQQGPTPACFDLFSLFQYFMTRVCHNTQSHVTSL